MKANFLSPKAKGYIIPNISIVLIAFLTKFCGWERNNTIVFSEFVVLPILMGIFSAWYWRFERYSSAQTMGRSCYLSLIGIALSFLFLGEGMICLVIVSPLLFVFIALGLSVGRAMFGYGNDTLNVSIVSLLLLIFFTDARMNHHYQNMVADEVVINAPVAKVWPNVIAYKKIEAPGKYWLFRIGMPSPVQSTATGNYIGAGRKCIFSNGYVFDERITRFDVNKNLTFAITRQPRDPEIMGHIDIQQGQFILHDNGNGTTTLTGNSWYALHVFPIWYYDLWAESITRNVHLRVMAQIKQLSEAQ